MIDDQVKALAGRMNITDKQLRKLADKYGDGLESVLRKWWNETKDKVKIPGAQGGYTTSPFAALRTSDPDDSRRRIEPEAVSDEYQAEITSLAHARWERYMRNERQEEITKRELRAVNQALREVALQAVQSGVDPGPLLEAVKAQIASQQDEINRRAA